MLKVPTTPIMRFKSF